MALFGLMLVGPAPAQAEEQPAILKSYGLDWIERVKEEAWPQPKLERPVICLLDTGVAVTPDTPADNPMGPIVARLSVEDPVGVPNAMTLPPESDTPSLGLPQGESWLHLHGTRMAAIIAAPRNGTGTVGIFPQARIVSVRVTKGTETYVDPANIELGARTCRSWALRGGVDLAAVVMAESRYDQRPQDVPKWETAAILAGLSNGVLVAAMGNRDDAELVAPLAASSVVAVGAGDDLGLFCPGVPKASNQIVGPGCSSARPGWYEGSSSATAAVGALVAAIATRRPGARTTEIRNELDILARPNAAGWARLDAAGAPGSLFAGLVESPQLSSPRPPEIAIVRDRGASAEAPPTRLWRPSAVLTWRKGKLTVRRTKFASRGALRIKLPGTPTPLVTHRHRQSFREVKYASRVEIWAESRDGKSWRSLSRRVKVRTS